MTEPRRFTLDRAFMFDLSKTSRLAELFQLPRDARNTTWVEAFLDAAWHASLQVAEPPFFEGPDGFVYLRLQVPTPREPFQSNSLSNVAAFALQRGTGVAIFASAAAAEPEFVLSMGRLDSLVRYDSWRGDPLDLDEVQARAEARTTDEHGMETLTLRKDLQIAVGAPSANVLPPYTAAMLHRTMSKAWHIDQPRIALMIAPGMAPSRNLVLGRKLSQFADAKAAAMQMQALLWYLPPERSLMLMPEDWTTDRLYPLTDYFKPLTAEEPEV